MEQKPWYKKASVLAAIGFLVIGGLVFYIAMHLAAMKP